MVDREAAAMGAPTGAMNQIGVIQRWWTTRKAASPETPATAPAATQADRSVTTSTGAPLPVSGRVAIRYRANRPPPS
jgi:hypothetical protein